MRPLCGKTIKGAIGFASLTVFIVFLFQMITKVTQCAQRGCDFKMVLIFAGGGLVGCLVLWCFWVLIKKCLVKTFPVACGHRKIIFTGRSSKSLQEILMSVDTGLPSTEQLQSIKHDATGLLDDIRAALERSIVSTTFSCVFSGSAAERYGIPFTNKTSHRSEFSALYTDLDIMFCYTSHIASFAGQGSLLIEPLEHNDIMDANYANLTSLTPGFEGQSVSSKLVIDQAKEAVGETKVRHLPGVPCCCRPARCELTPKLKFDKKGPAIKIKIEKLFEADVTLSIKCLEWPVLSDWTTRPRNWPRQDDVRRIASHGCHLVAKAAPYDEEQASWRISFSTAEVELSELVPSTARKCFLALKVVLKDHLQPVVPEVGSYHMKTIFLNTLEKMAVGFWVDEDIEDCFLTLLKNVHEALENSHCAHHWFSHFNLFSEINRKHLNILARKVQRILQNPAPFIYDDGCCCLSLCCTRVPEYEYHRRSSQAFWVECDDIAMTARQPVDPTFEMRHENLPTQRADEYPCRLTVALPPLGE